MFCHHRSLNAKDCPNLRLRRSNRFFLKIALEFKRAVFCLIDDNFFFHGRPVTAAYLDFTPKANANKTPPAGGLINFSAPKVAFAKATANEGRH
ncbi:MAG: hypothetical protein WA103_00535 [Minisyncoccales bacterium]